MNLSTKQKQTHRHREQLMVTKEERGLGRDKLGVWDQQVQTTIYKIDKTTRSYCIEQGTIFNSL